MKTILTEERAVDVYNTVKNLITLAGDGAVRDVLSQRPDWLRDYIEWIALDGNNSEEYLKYAKRLTFAEFLHVYEIKIA